MYQDALSLVQQVDRQTPLYALGAATLLVPLTQLDHEINPAVQRANTGRFGEYLDYANNFGGPQATLPVATLFAFTLFTNDSKLQDAAFTSLQSLLYTGGINYALKYAFGRKRPHDTNDTFRFAPFSGNTSFPSGHTATAFAVLTPWVLYYPNAVTYGLMAISAGTGLARLARNKHWATDVVAGGTVGFLTSYWLTKRHLGQSGAFSITPSLSPDAPGVSLSMTF